MIKYGYLKENEKLQIVYYKSKAGRPKIKFYRCKMKNEGLIPKAITNMKFNVKKKGNSNGLSIRLKPG